MLPLALLVALAAHPVQLEVRPCVAALTVRDAPSVNGKRLGVITARSRLRLTGRRSAPERLSLTVDRDVPAPLMFSPEDAWLEVLVDGDGGARTGWVFGGLVCRPRLVSDDTKVSLVGWSKEGHLAFLEYALDSFACGSGAPQTLRIVDPTSGTQQFELYDGCPAAELLVSRREEIDRALTAHGIALTWDVSFSQPTGLTAEFKRADCAKRQYRGCPAAVVFQAQRRAGFTVSLFPQSVDDAGGYPRVVPFALLAHDGQDYALVRVLSSELEHRVYAVRLKAASP